MHGGIRKTILLVEDEAIIALHEQRVLEQYGYAVRTARSGEEAIELCAASGEGQNPDLILMDIDLGCGMDGTEAARLILERRSVPVVFLSSHTEPEIVEKTENITSYGYIVKSSSGTVMDASIKMAFKLFEANVRMFETNVKLEAMLGAIPDLLFEVDLAGTYLDVHCPDPRLLVAPGSELLGRAITETLPAEAADVIMDGIRDANEAGVSVGRRYHLTLQSGEKWFELSVSRMADAWSTPRFILICHDITDRKRAEDELNESKRHAERLLSVAAEIVMSTDTDGIITMFNDNGHRLLGYEPPELVGKRWADVCLPEENRDEVAGFLDALARGETGVLVPHENPVLCKDGSRKLILWHNTVLSDDSGAYVGILSSGQDITALRQLEARIRESEARYRTMIEASPDNITVTDLQGNIVMSSPKAAPMFGYEHGDSQNGRSILDFLVPGDRARAGNNFGRILRGETHGAELYTGLRKDGSSFPVEINGQFIAVEYGHPAHVLFIVRDISARGRVEGTSSE